MSYEMKDILKTMIDNNEPHWSADTMDMARAEFEYVYARADEHEAKAKAFDEGLEAVHDRLQHILHNTNTNKLLPGYVDGMYNALDIINDCYESGESDE